MKQLVIVNSTALISSGSPADISGLALGTLGIYHSDDTSTWLSGSAAATKNFNIVAGRGANVVPAVMEVNFKTLKVTIYGATEEDDKTILMQVGKRYAITYMTQSGLRTADGYLRYISSSIPDECTRYISATNPTEVALSFIGLDCSTKGISDKRKIYIASIRGIEALADDEDYIPPVDKDNATYTLYEVLAALNKATEALKEMNENNVCQQVLSGIDRIETDLLDLIERVTPDDHGNNTEPTNP
jgi:hypothetical protein